MDSQDNKQEEKIVDKDLTEALKQSFPASDPVSVGQPTGTHPPAAPGEPLPRKAKKKQGSAPGR